MVLRALEPFGVREEAGRSVVSGDEVDLRPEPALAIAMGLHELATTAAMRARYPGRPVVTKPFVVRNIFTALTKALHG